MKKIALITDGWQRYVTGAWIIGYRQYLQEHQLDADLYVFHSFGNFSKDEKYNQENTTSITFHVWKTSMVSSWISLRLQTDRS